MSIFALKILKEIQHNVNSIYLWVMRLWLDCIVYVLHFGYVYIGQGFMINSMQCVTDQLEKRGLEEERQTQTAGSVTQLAWAGPRLPAL